MSEIDIFRKAFGKPDHAVYPGHPLTLAWLITETFPSFEEAFRSDPFTNISYILGSSKIPGAGGNVCAAMDVLKFLKDGGGFKEAVRRGNDMWEMHTTSCMDKRRSGQEQAEKIVPLLRKNKSWWRSPGV